MIAAISLMRQRDDVTLAAFRRHWLDVHGPLVCAFPALRRYVQDHVIASPAMNARARDMRIDGFPILWFDNDADRLRAHSSPAMAACNVDFAAVHRRRVAGDLRAARDRATGGRCGPHEADRTAARAIARMTRHLSALRDRARTLPRLAGLVLYRVLEQGPAPNSTIPHLPVSAAGIAELAFAQPGRSGMRCRRANDLGAAHFVVEEHRLA